MEKKEAMKILKDFHDKSALFSVRTAIETLHPELAESEDEKIRKALVDTFKFYDPPMNSPFLLGIDKKDILAWLERQVTPQMVEDAFLKGCNDTKKSLLKRQGEQKSTEILKWSAQEEYCICELEAMVREAWGKAENVRNEITIKKMQELMFFLKTLNPNKKPQRMISAEAKEAMYDKPACAWSEEDERNLNDAILFIETGTYSLDKDNLINWLKSLKERAQHQNSWKPSDEQIVVLELASKYERVFTPKQIDILIDLKEQLKKLKE